jgi:IclR family pca regulon transcriptional regulator
LPASHFPTPDRWPLTPRYAILRPSTFDDAAIARWMAEHEFSSFTPDGSRDPERFREWTPAARTLGYRVTEQLVDLGLRGIALPLKERRATAWARWA